MFKVKSVKKYRDFMRKNVLIISRIKYNNEMKRREY